MVMVIVFVKVKLCGSARVIERKIKIILFLFCSLLTYSYLCKRSLCAVLPAGSCSHKGRRALCSWFYGNYWSVVLLSCALKPRKFHGYNEMEYQWFTRMRGLLYLYLLYSGFPRTSKQRCGAKTVSRFCCIFIIRCTQRLPIDEAMIIIYNNNN